MNFREPIVLLDSGPQGELLSFARPERIIQAFEPRDVPGAFAALEDAVAKGRHLAGWFSYELGAVLSPRLTKSAWSALPLLWFGVFDAPERLREDALGPRVRAYAGPLRHEWDEAAYAARFARAHAYIGAGDIYQVNLSFRSHFAFAGDALGFYLALRNRAQMRHGAYIDTGTQRILSFSPEQFFAISPDGAITARPMKGTAPRGEDARSDAQARQALAASEKDRAENLMIVDLMRNDLGRVAEIGSVTVQDLFAVETYPTLHTMVSTVRAQLKPATRLGTIINALFPCGSITGAPKIRAMEIIRELEASPRGVYCGAIGHFAPDGSAAFNVAIRTAVIEGNRGTLGIGGAVVQDSKPHAEYAECLLKARFFEGAREPIGLIETLRWDGEAFVRLDLHLARMERSAAFFSLPFDRTAALAALTEAAGQLPAALRVRLTLDEAGHFAGTAAPIGQSPAQWTFVISPERVDSCDTLLHHKTIWRTFFDAERDRIEKTTRADEALFRNERGELTEGSRATLFIRSAGKLLTPALSCGLLDGVLRRALLAQGACTETILTLADLETAEEIWLGNSLRGLIRAVPV